MDSEYSVQLLRRMLHDYANHIQLLSGWLDLGRPEMMREVLTEVRAMLNRDREIFHHRSAEAALYLYSCIQQAADIGFILVYEELDFSSLEILKRCDQPLAELRKKAKAGKLSEARTYLSLHEDDQGIDLFFAMEEGDSWKLRLSTS